MCGRYSFKSRPKPETVVYPDKEQPPLVPRYNIAPTQYAPIVPQNDAEKLHYLRWGLIPSWAKDPKVGATMINARAETLAQKPAFRTLVEQNRCLVPASGFFEWKVTGKVRRPQYIHCPGSDTIHFAGLFTEWKTPDGDRIHSFTIITTTPNALMAGIHNRMPVILSAESARAWLDPDLKPQDLPELLVPYPADLMEAYPVSDRVGKVQNDDAELLLPITPQGEQGLLF